jgi:hypothetical protein
MCETLWYSGLRQLNWAATAALACWNLDFSPLWALS